MAIRNIIFDLGGVILDIDYSFAAKAFTKLGLENFDELYSKKMQSSLFDDFEQGIISASTFRNELKKHLPDNVNDKMIDEAWNAMLLNIPQKRIDYLRELKKNYRLFLLSNTNTIHIAAFTKIINDQHGENALDKIFEKVYFSCNMNLRKPMAAIFLKVLNDNNLGVTESLFIDDSIQHIEGAEHAGLLTLHLEKGQTVEDVLPEILK